MCVEKPSSRVYFSSAMLADRSYMRSPSYGSNKFFAIPLIVLLIVAFVGQSLLEFYFQHSAAHLALSLDGIRHGKVWQFLSFQFLHMTPWPWHVLGNCLVLYFFGRAVEEALGSVKFISIYFAAGILGGVVQVLSTWLLPGHADNPVVGASAGVLGILAVFATLFPEQDGIAFLYFFPIRIKAKYLFWFLFLLSLYGTLVPYGGVAYGAHLGGMLVGYVYVRWILQSEVSARFWNSLRRPRPRKEYVPARISKGSNWRQLRDTEEELPSAEFISREVDPILDKISAHGIHSLPHRERRILEAA